MRISGGCCCALALAGAAVAAPLDTSFKKYQEYYQKHISQLFGKGDASSSKNSTHSKPIIHKYTADAVDRKKAFYSRDLSTLNTREYHSIAEALVPDFSILDNSIQTKWVRFFECHPINTDGSFIDFTVAGTCGKEQGAKFKRDASQYAPFHLLPWKETSWFKSFWRTKHGHHSYADDECEAEGSCTTSSSAASVTTAPCTTSSSIPLATSALPAYTTAIAKSSPPFYNASVANSSYTTTNTSGTATQNVTKHATFKHSGKKSKPIAVTYSYSNSPAKRNAPEYSSSSGGDSYSSEPDVSATNKTYTYKSPSNSSSSSSPKVIDIPTDCSTPLNVSAIRDFKNKNFTSPEAFSEALTALATLTPCPRANGTSTYPFNTTSLAEFITNVENLAGKESVSEYYEIDVKAEKHTYFLNFNADGADEKTVKGLEKIGTEEEKEFLKGIVEDLKKGNSLKSLCGKDNPDCVSIIEEKY